MVLSTCDKKSGVSETLDPKSRVQKPVKNAGRVQPLAAVLTRSAAKTNAVVEKIAAVQDTHAVATQFEQSPTLAMNIDAKSESELKSEPEVDDFPLLPFAPLLKRTFESLILLDSIYNIANNQAEDPPPQNSNLMKKAGGHLNLVGPYLEEMEIDCPEAGAGYLVLISEGVSRAIRGEEIFPKTSKCADNMPSWSKFKKSSWATTAVNGHNNAAINLTQRLPRKPSPPQGQSHEDRRVMVRLNSEHEARKTGPFLLRQQIQRMIPDPSLVADAIMVPSGVAILAPTPAKAATILQYKEIIAQRIGNSVVERQESWITSVIGPLPKHVSTMDSPQDPLERLLLQEPGFASIRDEVPIRQMAWTRRSKESPEPIGHVRVNVPETKANKFPPRLQLFGAAIGIQRIRERKPVTSCEKCHGFHSTRTFAHQPMCNICGTE
ncbi:hypothetical protein EV44_g3966 [Erysiphe necator]|uniref:Uncharacterized protein n=1 Tax=Uncinula necator TaxID=52586 RepID=A0A0B1P2N6_UNCNE|nr:hypothetical protein EV44_g3966 [Erysiphe necator]